MINRVPERLFITGIGTGIGKTLVSAILVEALSADYWKPVQAGFNEGTDSEWIRSVISNRKSVIHPEVYKLQLAASPHIAARAEQVHINLNEIKERMPVTTNTLIIEGAGGLMVPLNESEFVGDLIKVFDIPAILVSRNYLGSINHSLLTAMACKQHSINVFGWIFNDQYLNYESEIKHWSGLPVLASIPYRDKPDRDFVKEQAAQVREKLQDCL